MTHQQQRYAELFAAEAREHLAELSSSLVELDKQPGNRSLLDSVFRSVHTIKGMAAAMGYEVVTRLSHNAESVLAELRENRRQVDSATIDLLLEAFDQLGGAVEATVAGVEPPDPAVTIERLVLWRRAGERAAAAAAPDTSITAPLEKSAPKHRPKDPGRLRVDVRKLDALMNLTGELTILRGRLLALTADHSSEPLQEAMEQASRLIAELQLQVIESRMEPVSELFDRFPRLVRDAARTAGKEVELSISGRDLELDRTLLNAIADPLVHLLRNAVDHGIEPPAEREGSGKPPAGRIGLAARRERSRVVIEVTDDGRGINLETVAEKAHGAGMIEADAKPQDLELFRILSRPGFSTADSVTTLSGRGVGLNVVEECVKALGGSVELTTDRNVGTRLRLELPATLAIVRALIVEVAGQVYALPTTFTRESFELPGPAVERAHGREWVNWRGSRLPLTRLRPLFAAGKNSDNRDDGAMSRDCDDHVLRVVALEFGATRTAISVDKFVGEEEVVIKPFDLPRGAIPAFSGATVRPDGRPALVIDVGSLAQRISTLNL